MINSPQTIKGENRYGSRTVYNKKKKRATLKINRERKILFVVLKNIGHLDRK